MDECQMDLINPRAVLSRIMNSPEVKVSAVYLVFLWGKVAPPTSPAGSEAT